MKQGNTVIEVLYGDITKIDTMTAIVNATDESLLGNNGVDSAIRRAAGPRLTRDCWNLHGCRVGEAKITEGYNLSCKYVIHTVGPKWIDGKQQEAKLLENCYKNSLQLAVDYGIRKIAFSPISTGPKAFPLDEAATIAVQAVSDFITTNPNKIDTIVWVHFSSSIIRAYNKALDALEKKLANTPF